MVDVPIIKKPAEGNCGLRRYPSGHHGEGSLQRMVGKAPHGVLG
jgi:hypothetical protein